MSVGPSSRNRKWVFLSMVAGIAVLVLYLYFSVPMSQLAERFREINLFYYMLGFAAVLMSFLCFSLAWNSLLSGLSLKVSAWKTFLFSWVGMFVDQIVPGAVSGDLFKAYLISRDLGFDTGSTVASVVVQKLFAVAVMLATLIAGMTLLTLDYGFRVEFLALSVISVSLLVALFVLFVYISVKPNATEKIVRWIGRAISLFRGKNWNKAGFEESAQRSLNAFHQGVQSIRKNRRALIKAAIFSLMASVFDVFVVVLVFSSLNFPVPLDKALIVYSLTVSLQASGVSFIGFAEFLMLNLYTVLRVPITYSGAAVILIGFATTFFKLSIAFVSFQCVVLNRCVCSVCNKVSFNRNEKMIQPR